MCVCVSLTRCQDEATVQAVSLRQQVVELQGSQEQCSCQLLQLQSSVKQLEQGTSSNRELSAVSSKNQKEF